MEDLLNLTTSTFLLLLSFIFIFFFKSIFSNFFIKPSNNFTPKSYPLIGSLPSILRNKHRFIQWTSDVVNHAPTKTAVLRRPLGALRVVTANPDVVRHILKTSFHRYPKGETARVNAFDLLGHGIFNVDGDTWKHQRQVASYEFNTKSLRNFVEQVVDNELNHRLIPILTTASTTTTTAIAATTTGTATTTTTAAATTAAATIAAPTTATASAATTATTTAATAITTTTATAAGTAATGTTAPTTGTTTGNTGSITGNTGTTTGATGTTVLDLQDILQRFAFDNICQIAFGYDPAYLLPSLPEAVFATAFEEAVMITTGRIRSNLPAIWKLKRLLNVGSEKRLRSAVTIVREFATRITKQKKSELIDQTQTSSIEKPKEFDRTDLLSRFLISGHSDESLVADIVISFILAGRDTTSAALTWFFWLVSQNPRVEIEILREIRSKPEDLAYDDVKSMVYAHACLCESMRLFPPVAVDGKQAAEDDVLPDGTFVKKGNPVSYHIYAMGRSEEIWGPDWAEFRPERWLDKDMNNNTNTDKDKDMDKDMNTRWVFKGRDVYEYPVFQAGPRVCLGKEMAFLQMKRVAAGVLRRFRVVPAVDVGGEPEYVVYFTAKMKGGFPVRIEKRDEIE